MEKQKVLTTTGKIIANVLLYAFIIICFLGVTLAITAKRDSDGTSTIFGRQIRSVVSPSMEKCEQTDVSQFEIKDIPVNSMVFIETVPEDEKEADEWYAALKVGDVLTFKYVYVRQETITHRITSIEPKSTGGYIIKLEGDNKGSDANTLTQTIDTSDKYSYNYVIGKVTGQSYALGLFVSALKSPIGIICLIIIPAFAILIYEMVKISRLFSQEKREKAKKEQEEKQSEIEALRRRVAELETAEKADENRGEATATETDVINEN